MKIPTTNTEFFNRFPSACELGGVFGEWTDEADHLHGYYSNAAHEVGEIVYNKRTTACVYFLIGGPDARDVLLHYGRKVV